MYTANSKLSRHFTSTAFYRLLICVPEEGSYCTPYPMPHLYSIAKREYGWSTDMPEQSSWGFVASSVVVLKD